jgi:hypothetical protein
LSVTGMAATAATPSAALVTAGAAAFGAGFGILPPEPDACEVIGRDLCVQLAGV